ncbi:hypothetical protein HJG60_009711 [Phyllostomus discolor]|uniref:Uncharacterized protein n=1 Tax=Phyllostomus discolor TaxID=89673 RepID=A0A834EPT7_9CHIR|nr:hypothetical protein HJG60_009711 [Phyllostomus discolor]
MSPRRFPGASCGVARSTPSNPPPGQRDWACKTRSPRPSCVKSYGCKVGAVHLIHLCTFWKIHFPVLCSLLPVASLQHLWSKSSLSLPKQERAAPVAAVYLPVRLLYPQLSLWGLGHGYAKGVLPKPLWRIPGGSWVWALLSPPSGAFLVSLPSPSSSLPLGRVGCHASWVILLKDISLLPLLPVYYSFHIISPKCTKK